MCLWGNHVLPEGCIARMCVMIEFMRVGVSSSLQVMEWSCWDTPTGSRGLVASSLCASIRLIAGKTERVRCQLV